MKTLGFFDPQPASAEDTSSVRNILFHCDLEPRNILVKASSNDVETSNNQNWRITSILDWDDALSLPPILTRKPPVWLWDFSDDDPDSESIPDDYDGDIDLLPADWYAESSGRLSEEDLLIKLHFEECYVRKLKIHSPGMDMGIYYDEAYGKGQWIRRLARFALHGFSDSQDLKRLQRFEEEWKLYRLNLGNGNT